MLAAAAVVCLAHYVPAATRETAPVRFDASCETSDQAASAAVASLITQRTAVADAKLADAIFRLRRARKYCSYGWLTLAQQDYQALLDGRYRRQP